MHGMEHTKFVRCTTLQFSVCPYFFPFLYASCTHCVSPWSLLSFILSNVILAENISLTGAKCWKDLFLSEFCYIGFWSYFLAFNFYYNYNFSMNTSVCSICSLLKMERWGPAASFSRPLEILILAFPLISWVSFWFVLF